MLPSLYCMFITSFFFIDCIVCEIIKIFDCRFILKAYQVLACLQADQVVLVEEQVVLVEERVVLVLLCVDGCRLAEDFN